MSKAMKNDPASSLHRRQRPPRLASMAGSRHSSGCLLSRRVTQPAELITQVHEVVAVERGSPTMSTK